MKRILLKLLSALLAWMMVFGAAAAIVSASLPVYADGEDDTTPGGEEGENEEEKGETKFKASDLETIMYASEEDKLLTMTKQTPILDAEGNPVMDGNQPQTRDSDEEKMLKALFESAKAQQSRLNSTRAALTDLRGKLEGVVNELNKLKPIARQDKVTITEKEERIAKLEGEKTELENQITKIKAQIDELNTEITSLKDEVAAAKDETERAKEEVAKSKKIIESLRQMLKESIQNQGGRSANGGAAVTSLPAGDKGKIVEADNENMFAIVEFSEETMKEIKGDDGSRPLPALELGVKRPGFKGEAGEFIGRLRLRQEVKGKPYVICDILGAWEQDKIAPNDIIFAD